MKKCNFFLAGLLAMLLAIGAVLSGCESLDGYFLYVEFSNDTQLDNENITRF